MKRVLKPLLAILFGIFWALAIAEIGARVLAAQGLLPSRMPADLFVSHPIGWSMQPRLRATVPSLAGNIVVQINDIGFRDDTYPTERVDGLERFLVLGDSYVAAIETPQSETFHQRLEDQLDGEVEVMTFAATGYSTQQEVLAFETIGEAYQPDVVVLMLYVGNDLTANGTVAERPYYALQPDGELAVQNYPYSGDYEMQLVAGTRSTWWMRLSQIGFLIGVVTNSQPSADPDSTDAAQDVPPAPTEDDSLATRYCDYEFEASYPTPSDDAWAITEALLLHLKNRVEANGAALRIAVIPTEFQVDVDHEQEFLERCAYPAQSDWTPPQDRLIPFLENNDFVFLDLRAPLGEARAEGRQPMYLANIDNHWSPEGHAAAAAALYDWLDLGE